ncbi:MAG: ATP-binding cassette domain-containing protein [Mitsuaria chitosanitabida]|uniref:ABC transporter transmembrane domain-containing protein n=1 Tax=Roseateles chitosanitabidus TaxID=65048 RepID=UPI001B265052|nr:ABC transporter transmembrane domain-containing protein [Roseateles chitosanitabidus]MBO9685249.1 ATP-binding cassette domain-containing protein [Roseateles chitosanitabidus]
MSETDYTGDEPLKLTAKRLWRFMKPHRWGLMLSVVAFVLVAATEPLIPKLLGYALGEGFQSKSASASSSLPALGGEATLPAATTSTATAAASVAEAPAASAASGTAQTAATASIAGASASTATTPAASAPAAAPAKPTVEYSFPVWMVPIVLIGLFGLRGLFSFCGQYMLNWTISRTVMDIRAALLQVLLKADARVYTSLQPATAVTKVVNDPQQVVTLIAGALVTVLRDGLPALALMGYLFVLNWQLTLLSMITVPGLAFVVRKVNKRVRKMGSWAYDAQLRLVSVVEDVTRAWRVVRSFDAADYERKRFAERAREVQRSALKTAAANAMAQPLSQLMASVGISIIVSLALLQSRQNQTGVGEFASFVTALLFMSSRLRHLSDVMQPITNALVVARGCMGMLDTPAEPDTGTKELHGARGDIALERVTLRYPGASRDALAALDMRIPAGRTTALVGSSGAGKTSVVNLLMGFERPDGGRITLDGVAIDELTKANLRRQFAVVSQDIVLFDASVADNIAYAQERDDAKLEQVLRAAALWDFVQSLPEGLDSSIGANGSKLSGGQRQRLAIARALYKDAPVWIFDEATSALDTESERAVQQALEHWQGRKTLIVIAHRLSTIRRADCIQVLADGQVVESGNHDELMARDGAYAGMVKVQH